MTYILAYIVLSCVCYIALTFLYTDMNSAKSMKLEYKGVLNTYLWFNAVISSPITLLFLVIMAIQRPKAAYEGLFVARKLSALE